MFIWENFEPLWHQLLIAILESLLFYPLGKQPNFTSNEGSQQEFAFAYGAL